MFFLIYFSDSSNIRQINDVFWFEFTNFEFTNLTAENPSAQIK